MTDCLTFGELMSLAKCLMSNSINCCKNKIKNCIRQSKNYRDGTRLRREHVCAISGWTRQLIYTLDWLDSRAVNLTCRLVGMFSKGCRQACTVPYVTFLSLTTPWGAEQPEGTRWNPRFQIFELQAFNLPPYRLPIRFLSSSHPQGVPGRTCLDLPMIWPIFRFFLL